MTPQELIDLPGYGSAEKELRRTHRWKLTKEERIGDLIARVGNIEHEAQNVSADLYQMNMEAQT